MTQEIPIIDFSENIVEDNAIKFISVSQALGLLSEPFNSDEVAQKTYDKHFNNPCSQYYHKTKDEIKAMWEAKGAESCNYGRMLDEYIRVMLEGDSDDVAMYELDNDIDGDERLNGLCKSFNQFLQYIKEKRPSMQYVTREKMLYYKISDFYVRGRFDALFYDTEKKKWIIVDWKSSGTIDKEKNKWTKNLLGPARIFPALNWYTYTLQVYLYKAALLAHYLPEGTNPDDIEVYIVNLPGKPVQQENIGEDINDAKYFAIHSPAFSYDKTIIDNIFNFAFKKNELLEKKKTAE